MGQVAEPRIAEEKVIAATGRGWAEWFKILDQIEALAIGHKAAAAKIKAEFDCPSWWSQMVVIEYEVIKGARVPRERSDGKFGVDVSRTIAVPLARAWWAWSAPEGLNSWFTTGHTQDFVVGGRFSNNDRDSGTFKIIEAEKRIKFTWENAQHGPGSSVTVLFESKGPEKCVVRLSHERLASVADADDLKGGWSWAMDSLKSYLETGRPIPHDEWVKAQKP